MTSMQSLKAELSELDQRLYAAWRQEREDARRQIVALALEFQLFPNTVAMDVGAGHRWAEPQDHLMTAPKVDLPLRGPGLGQFVAPKYRHPHTDQSWTGRGRTPQWIHELLATGMTLDDLLISTGTSESTDPLRSFQDAAKRRQLKKSSKHSLRGRTEDSGRAPGLNLR